VAYNTATGAQRWVQRYNGPANGGDSAKSLAVSPDGAKVYVTGDRVAPNGKSNYATVAYNAATGAQLWVNSYNGPANGDDFPRSVVVSSTGGTVFVTGVSYDKRGYSADYATVAYNAATGAQRWVHRYDGPYGDDDQARSMAVSPAGGTVYVTGSGQNNFGSVGYATVAYNAATGAQLWIKQYGGPGDHRDQAYSVAVSPAGGTVYVTGVSDNRDGTCDYATVAYNPATGAQLWAKRYNGPANLHDFPSSVVVSPDGAKVFVTGTSYNDRDMLTSDAATITYSG
jgi:DNA-binding beta-propeller fold protein YncE